MNQLNGIEISKNHKRFKDADSFNIYITCFKETDTHLYLFFDKITSTLNNDFVDMEKRSEYDLISSYDKINKVLIGQDVLETLHCPHRYAGQELQVLGYENEQVEITSDLGDFVRRYITLQNKHLSKLLCDYYSSSWNWNCFVKYLDCLDSIEKLCGTMELSVISNQLWNGSLIFNDAKKLKSVIGLPVDVLNRLNDLKLGTALASIQNALKNNHCNVNEIKFLLDFIEGYNAVAKRKRVKLPAITSALFIQNIMDQATLGVSVTDSVNAVAREMLMYRGLEFNSATEITAQSRDTCSMLNKLNVPVTITPNGYKSHFLTARNYKIFNNSRSDEYEAAAKRINDRLSVTIGEFVIKCPETEAELLRIGNAYKSCIPIYRDKIIDNGAIILSVYNNNEPNNIPEVTFEITPNLEFLQIKTFFDMDVSNEETIQLLKDWKQIVKRKLKI